MDLSFRKLLFGRPLRSEGSDHQRLPIILALPIFASDALSSVAYATEQILHNFHGIDLDPKFWSAAIPISIAIIGLISMVVISYRKVINAYPQGGGSYVVARENLGLTMGLIAASSLLVDYVLTVAVSIADCVSQSFSAIQVLGGSITALEHSRVLVAIGLVLLITIVNLRGAKESGAVFAGPSYGFIAIIFTLLAVGFWKALHGAPPVGDYAHALEAGHKATSIDWLVLIRGFASGCAALTGIEAVSNGVQAFKKPEAQNANKTLAILGVILGIMFIGITYLAIYFKALPGTETVISQLARAAFGTSGTSSILYYAVQIFTALILFLAANTAFAGFPRLASILAEDSFLPRQLATMGDRLAFNNGIIVLGGAAILFLSAFHAETHALLPLYTIGVFIAFTSAQFGMVIRTLKGSTKDTVGLIINSVGGVVTGVVLIVVTFSKFVAPEQPPIIQWRNVKIYEGAWMAILLMALVVLFFKVIYKHYNVVDTQLAALPDPNRPPLQHTVIVLVPSRVHRGIVQAVQYASSISAHAIAVHIAFDRSKEKRLFAQWEAHCPDVPLIILDSPYRTLVRPLMDYLDQADKVRDDDIITVVIPEFVPARWWHHFLHNSSGWMLRLRLFYRKDIVITSIRYYLDE